MCGAARADRGGGIRDDGGLMDNAFLLLDRKQKIQSVFRQYGIENFYISFSGGKDSTVLSWLIDQAAPGNQIPRVYADTGIEYKMVREFVKNKAEKDDRFVMIRPSVSIKKSLERDGYPFKSKLHSAMIDVYQRHGLTYGVKNYLGIGDKTLYRSCPDALRYQFTPAFHIRISDKCCVNMKEEPLKRWAKDNHKPYHITGIMHDEGGRRERATCLVFKRKNLTTFNPLIVLSKDWEEWAIQQYKIKICDIYKPPYNFYRTGCKGCPFAIDIQGELDTLERFFPSEKKQCERIWKPIYDEYRRIGYRLKKDDGKQVMMEFDQDRGII